MHESGVVRKLLRTALAEAELRGGRLATVRVRLGALSAGDADHFRAHFDEARAALGAGEIALEVEVDPARPVLCELLAIDVQPAS